MRLAVAYALGVGLALNGLVMLAAPGFWYGTVPGVDETGPLNTHFVRDIGCAYLLAGIGPIWAARDPRGWSAGVWAAAFLGLHALVHVADALAGREGAAGLLRDAPTVFAPALIAAWLAGAPRNREMEHAEMVDR